jgi:hypothetical protein
MNLPFCCWLLARRRRKIFVMFHEVAIFEEVAFLGERGGSENAVPAVLAPAIVGAAIAASIELTPR